MNYVTNDPVSPYNQSPSPTDLSLIRSGAEIQQMKPYMDSEIAAMQKAVVSSVLSAVNNGTLTPDIAMSKWMEYIAYQKLSQHFEQKIRMGVSTSANKRLDF